jgi:DNA polymerase I-like protein with 3'-5' exonuclease and polymerase domains
MRRIDEKLSQAEIRWWALLSKDKKFAQRFADMKALREQYHRNPTEELKAKVKAFCDIHRQVASLMYGVDILKVTDDQRQAAKSLAFGSIYGQSHYTLAEILSNKQTGKIVTPDEALEIQKRFLTAFPDAGKWLSTIEIEAERKGYVESPFGRRRRLHAFFASGVKGIIGSGKRRARNSPIQSASSDTTSLAAWLMLDYIQRHKKKWRIVDVVHDAILMEVPLNQKEIQKCMKILKRIMTKDVFKVIERDFGFKSFVPFECDYKLGTRLGHMSKDLTDDNLKSEVKRLKKESVKS